ncbi:MAG: glycosyltransferase family 4 protein [Ignavibacteria bacterium]|nr:glycosyltransferase family 4 protein [Ignavibacteria bacterium]
MKLNILHISPDFNYACGRSYYVFLLLKYLSRKHNVIFISDKGDSFDRIGELNVRLIKIKGLHSKNPVSLAKNIGLLSSLIKKFDIDIIHTHHRHSELLAVNANRLAGIRAGTVFTSLSIVNRKYNLEYSSDVIIAVSNTVKKMLTGKFGVNESKIRLIPNFTDTDEINELELLAPFVKDDYENFTLLALGRFHSEKNFETILHAMKIINEKKVKLILVGEGEKYTDYMKFIRGNNLNVEFHKPQRNIILFFLTANICILPSAVDPFPNFMLQCGLHRKPFIGSDVDGIAELIKDGKNGLLFRKGNAEELALKIMKFREDISLARKCSSNLHRDVINNYTQEFIIPKIERLYREIRN